MQFTELIDPSAKLRVLLSNHQTLLGDRLVMTSFIRDLKATYPHWQISVDVETSDVWLNNPNVEAVYLPGDPPPEKMDFAWQIGPGKATQGSKANGVHLVRGFHYGWMRLSGLPIHNGPWKPDLHLSKEELAYQPIAGDYWLFNPDTNNMGSKRWPADRWRDLIRSMPGTRFVQVGLGRNLVADYGDEPNVTSLVDRTTERELFALVYHATGCISLLSSLTHIAAAFDKPCVVLAGGREPDTFAHYPGHYYISRVGMLPCCRMAACWHNSIEACTNKVPMPDGPVARCMTTISTADVARGIESYYEGGRISPVQAQSASEMVVNILLKDLTQGARSRIADSAEAAPSTNHQSSIINHQSQPPRLLRLVTNGKYLGGAERSCLMIATMFRKKGWQVELATRQPMCDEMRRAFAPVAVETDRVSRPCDVLLWYASDQVYDADKPEFAPLREAAGTADRRVMALTYKLGKVPDLDWCRGWDQYLFLSSAMRDSFAKRCVPNHPSSIINHQLKVLAPPVDLDSLLAVEPVYDAPIRVVRHSGQGDNKWPLETRDLVLACPGALFQFMPAPIWLEPAENLTKRPYAAIPVRDHLAGGSLFLYLLPPGYTDQGPRVIVEAMAAGLPVIAEQRDGAADRVTQETGWFMADWQQAAALINSLPPDLLAAKGRAAKERARTEFSPWRWYEAISGEKL